MTIIESLWYGDIATNERKIENDDEYNKIKQFIIKQEGELKKLFPKSRTCCMINSDQIKMSI